jgi:SAM-dependent methyltransferase
MFSTEQNSYKKHKREVNSSLHSERQWRQANSFVGGVEKKLSMVREEQMRIDEIYKNRPLEEIPWNMETPPEPLVELVDSGKVQPCKTIDMGCGAGNYAVYLAEKGFEVTGVDYSPTAIEIAGENANKKGVKCNFIVADVVEEADKINQTWDFAYGWGLLHHIFPEQRQRYVENVYRILNPKGKYLSVCFSQEDTGFGGSGKFRKTSLGSVLYFSSEDELRELFKSYFKVIDLRTIEISGKFEPHIFNYVFMERK